MERFYGKDHSVALSNQDAEQLIAGWRNVAADLASSDVEHALVSWLDERLERRAFGFRAFRIAPAPEPIAARPTLDFFATILACSANTFAKPEARFGGRTLSNADRCAWLARSLDLLAFANQARDMELDAGAPKVRLEDVDEITLHRMWARFNEASRMEDQVFPDDPRYPDPERLLTYLDEILALAEATGREERRQWPFPKILWEREILLEKLGRFDEMAKTMRRSAALEDESFRRQTEEYIAVVVSPS